jgi:hypothetical protein
LKAAYGAGAATRQIYEGTSRAGPAIHNVDAGALARQLLDEMHTQHSELLVEHGLAMRPLTANYNPDQPRDANGRWGRGMDKVPPRYVSDARDIDPAKEEAVFGRHLEPDEYRAMVGVTDAKLTGERVQISTSHDATHGPYVAVSVNAGECRMYRTFFKDQMTGKLACDNDYFRVNESDHGLGTKIFHAQVEELASRGFDHIETFAARGAGSDFVGYYVWPRLGYDAPLRDSEKAATSSIVEGATHLSNLMRTESGRAWWKENGGSRDVKFDLSANSLGRRVLSEYARHRAEVTHNALSPDVWVDDALLDSIWDKIV